MAALNDCVCQHVGYCDGSCQHPEPVSATTSAGVREEQTPRVTEDSDKSPTAIDRLRMHLHDPETFDLDASDLESVVAEFEDLEASLSFRVDAPVESVKIDAEALGLNTAISEEAKSALAAIDAAQRPAQRVYAPVSQKEAGKYCTCANSVTSDPCIVCGKPKFITREWFERRAAAEGDLEIGAGSPSPAPAVEPVGIKAHSSVKDMLTNFGTRRIREGSRMIFADAGDYWEDYIEVPVIVLEAIRSALHPTPTPAPVGVVEELIREAIDLLKEKKHGNPARSPGHNARLMLEDALASLRSPAVEGK